MSNIQSGLFTKLLLNYNFIGLRKLGQDESIRYLIYTKTAHLNFKLVFAIIPQVPILEPLTILSIYFIPKVH